MFHRLLSPLFALLLAVAWPEIDGNIAVGEEMLVVGFGPWQYENARGNQGTLTMNDLGDLTSEVTSGPFLGTKYSWLRLP